MLVSVLPDLYCINMYQYYFPEHRYSPCSCSNHSGRRHIMSMPPFLGLSSLFHSNYEIQASFSKYALLHPAHDIDGRCSWRWDGGKAGKANLNLILYMHEIFKNGLLQSTEWSQMNAVVDKGSWASSCTFAFFMSTLENHWVTRPSSAESGAWHQALPHNHQASPGQICLKLRLRRCDKIQLFSNCMQCNLRVASRLFTLRA